MTPQLGRIARLMQEGSFYALLLLLPFSKAACEIAFGFLLLGWGIERCRPETRAETIWTSPRLRPLALGIVAYLLVCSLSILESDVPRLSVEGFVEKWLEYLLFLVIVADLVARPGVEGRPDIVRRGLNIMAWSSLCVAIQGVAQELFIATRRYRYDAAFVHSRMTGPYENPIDLATYLMVLIPILLGLSMGDLGPRRARLRVLILALIACLIRTEAIGAWLGLWIGLLVMAGLSARIRRTGLTLLIASAVVGSLFLQRMGRVYKFTSPTYIGRLDRWAMWQAAIRMIRDRPILGHGLNTFMANYLAYWVGGEQTPRYAHNCYLQVAAETGLVGLLSFLALLGLLAWQLLRRLSRLPADDRVLLVGLGGGLLAFAVQAGLDTNFYALRQAVLFWVLAGLAVGLSERDQPLGYRRGVGGDR